MIKGALLRKRLLVLMLLLSLLLLLACTFRMYVWQNCGGYHGEEYGEFFEPKGVTTFFLLEFYWGHRFHENAHSVQNAYPRSSIGELFIRGSLQQWQSFER